MREENGIVFEEPSATPTLSPLKIRTLLTNIDFPDGCWIWKGRCNEPGYGHWGKHALAHRAMWTIFYGPIPDGYELHHSCENKACVNPNHLRMVTRKEHAAITGELKAARSTGCTRGHPWSPENTGWRLRDTGRWERYCRACNRKRARLAAKRKREHDSKKGG